MMVIWRTFLSIIILCPRGIMKKKQCSFMINVRITFITGMRQKDTMLVFYLSVI